MSDIIAVISSPRKDGNSEAIVKAVAKGAESKGKKVKFVYTRDLPAAPCKACDYCKTKDRCVMKDEIADVIDDIRKCEGLILSSPCISDRPAPSTEYSRTASTAASDPTAATFPPERR